VDLKSKPKITQRKKKIKNLTNPLQYNFETNEISNHLPPLAKVQSFKFNPLKTSSKRLSTMLIKSPISNPTVQATLSIEVLETQVSVLSNTVVVPWPLQHMFVEN
jgi:hypothetical protein